MNLRVDSMLCRRSGRMVIVESCLTARGVRRVIQPVRELMRGSEHGDGTLLFVFRLEFGEHVQHFLVDILAVVEVFTVKPASIAQILFIQP